MGSVSASYGIVHGVGGTTFVPNYAEDVLNTISSVLSYFIDNLILVGWCRCAKF